MDIFFLSGSFWQRHLAGSSRQMGQGLGWSKGVPEKRRDIFLLAEEVNGHERHEVHEKRGGREFATDGHGWTPMAWEGVAGIIGVDGGR